MEWQAKLCPDNPNYEHRTLLMNAQEWNLLLLDIITDCRLVDGYSVSINVNAKIGLPPQYDLTKKTINRSTANVSFNNELNMIDFLH